MTIRDSIIAAIAQPGPLTTKQIAEHVKAGSPASLRVTVASLVSDRKLVRSNDKWRSSYSLPEPQP